MVSKNNRDKKMEAVAERKPHFAIRKLTIGAASVLLGTSLWMSTSTSTVHADETDNNDSDAKTNLESNQSASTGHVEKVVVEQNQTMYPHKILKKVLMSQVIYLQIMHNKIKL